MHRYSFLAPSYKGRFIRESVGSMLAQTFDDFEVLVSDDCSPENLRDKLQVFGNDRRLVYHRNEVNIGAEHLAGHWNKLLAQTDSEYVIIASDDDLYDPAFLDAVDSLTHEYPDCNLFHVRSRKIDSEGNEIFADGPCGEMMSRAQFLDFLTEPGSVLCIGNYVFRTSALKAAGGFVDFPLAWKSDTATQLLLALNGVVTASDVLFSFRSSGLNTSSLRGDEHVDRLKIKACIEFRNWMKTQGIGNIRNVSKRLEGEMRSYYHSLSLPEFVRLYWSMFKEGWFSSCRSMISFAVSYFR